MRTALSYRLPEAIIRYPLYRVNDWGIATEHLIEQLVMNNDPYNVVMDVIDSRFNRILSTNQLLTLGSDITKTMAFYQHALRIILKDAQTTLSMYEQGCVAIDVIIDDVESELGIVFYETNFGSVRKRH